MESFSPFYFLAVCSWSHSLKACHWQAYREHLEYSHPCPCLCHMACFLPTHLCLNVPSQESRGWEQCRWHSHSSSYKLEEIQVITKNNRISFPRLFSSLSAADWYLGGLGSSLGCPRTKERIICTVCICLLAKKLIKCVPYLAYSKNKKNKTPYTWERIPNI